MEDVPRGHDAGQEAHEHRSDDGAHDVHGEGALGLRGVRTVNVCGEAQVGIPVDGVAGPDGFFLQAEKERHRQGDENGSQVSELLEQKGRSHLHQPGQVRPGPHAHLRHEGGEADENHSSRGAGLLHIEEPQQIGPEEPADDGREDHGEKGQRSDADVELHDADHIAEDSQNQRPRIHFPVPQQPSLDG
ncbi:hypothetical protein SDC9_155790 [bioreactor metagenome]|uniref:Uncharacterized protein n=1 Tax=bioreactor metagenome TaxID=1076179 RepID=A0A645F2G6_9ZZZZ